jgi:hypothetical protein
MVAGWYNESSISLMARGLSNAEIGNEPHRRDHCQDARHPYSSEARPARPRASGRARVPDGGLRVGPRRGEQSGGEHNDRFERLVIRVELVIDPAPRCAQKMCESPIRMAMLQRSRQIGGDWWSTWERSTSGGQPRGRLLSVPGGISRSPSSIRRSLSQDSGAAIRASIRDETYKTARPTSLRPMLPSVLRWSKK